MMGTVGSGDAGWAYHRIGQGKAIHSGRVDMRGAGFCMALIATILLLSSAVRADDEKPDAILQITQTSLALVFGYTWGSGTLAYADKSYPVEVDGFSFLSLGFVRAEATGEVFNLKKLDDFNGTYMAAGIEGTMGAGAGAATMRNQNGVVIRLFTTTEGLNLKVSPEGVRLHLK
jgi:hypothetical protein